MDLPVPPHRLEDLAWTWALPALGVLAAVAVAAAVGRAVPVREDDPSTPGDEGRGQGLRRLLRAVLQAAAFVGALTAFLALDKALHGDPRGLDALGKLGGMAAGLWAGFLGLDILRRSLRRRFEAAGNARAAAVLPLLGKLAKAAWAALCLVLLLDNLGFNISALLAGLGVGGLAIALAGQKTVENLFGGLVLVLDQPVRVGDYCSFGGKQGTVEDVGLRSIKIRTPDRTLITVPNGEFSQLQLENFARRDRIRYSTLLRLRHDTPAARVEKALKAVQALLDRHKGLDHRLTCRARLVELGEYSLDVEVFCYFKTADWDEYMLGRQALILDLLRAVEAQGARLAYPVHVQHEEKGARKRLS